jgi:Glycosyl transferase family 2
MTSPQSHDVAVIVASTNARASVHASLARFWHEVRGRGEVILVDASSDGTADQAERLLPGLRVLRCPVGSLVPELWRDGLRATDTSLVAFSTAAMVPRRGWLEAMLACLGQTMAAGVGGPIAPSSSISAFGRAVYLHRYANYLGPHLAAHLPDPPADNALYRRDRLLGLDSIIDQGFWEVSVHRNLRARGERLAFAPGAIVDFQGGPRRSVTFSQRFAHARHYSSDRSRKWSRAHRMARLAATPLLPAVLLERIVRTLRTRKESVGFWISAAPDLALLLASWSLGEAAGLWLGDSAG